MFKWIVDNGFSFFLVGTSGEKIHLENWAEFQEEYLAQFSILYEWVDNGVATKTNYTIDIEAEEVLQLNEVDRSLLNLPEPYPYSLFVESEGILSQNSFRFKYGFYDFIPNGNRLFFQRKGGTVISENSSYLLSLKQYKVLEAIDRFNSLPEEQRTYHQNLISFADIKIFSDEEAAVLDSFLESQNVEHPDKIKIDVSFKENVLEVVPLIDGLERESILKAFDRSPSIKSVYNSKNQNGGTTRVIVDKDQQEELRKVKSHRRIHDPELIKEIAENPENFFDDEILDLKFFSERVREIGLYKPKFYPFVCPYKTEWIPGIVLKDKVNGEKKIHFKTPVELAEFVNEKEHAQKEGKTHFTFKDEEIDVEDAEKFITIAEKQFEKPEAPVINEETDNSKNDVLIIKENADLLEYVEEISVDGTIEHKFSDVPNLASEIRLKTHQVEGVAWLQSLFQMELNGCLLADDMGLGKTLQILYFIEWHAQKFNHDKPYLVVAPVSLLENWQNEYEKFFKPTNLSLRPIYGATGVGREFSRQTVEGLQKKQIILTNYESLRSYQLNLCAVDYAVVVLDEAQKIKTPGTMVTNVSKALKAEFKIAMTGTPVENTLVDLWCIMDFSVPGLLGNAKDFAKNYQKPLSNEETDVRELTEKLRQEINIFIKRRLKTDVAKDLPKKKVKVLTRVMPEAQAERYSLEIEMAKKEDLEGVERRNQILKSLWAIRDISDHPYLLDSQISRFRAAELVSSSAKLQVVIETLEEVKRKDEKVILFADRKETQKMLQKVIFEIFEIPPPSIINGETPSSKQKEKSSRLSRQQTIDRFQKEKGFNVIIMSQLAAGVGLNVTGANHIIHYSRHWNPAKEEQATDRAYRIGQTKDVTVYYPMAVFPDEFRNEKGEKQKSFDEILDILLTRKKTLASNTLFPTEQSEVKPDEIFGNVFQSVSKEVKNKPLTIDEIDKLNPRHFEAFVAALYSKQGYQVYLTPFANDKGVDVVAVNSQKNYLIQAKQSQSSISSDAVREVFGAKNYYAPLFKETFELNVLSNNFSGNSARMLAKTNNVDVIERDQLKRLIKEYPVSIQDITRHESQRMKKI